MKHEQGFAGVVAGHVETLRREFQSTPRNASLRDLCVRFSQFLKTAFPLALFSIAYRNSDVDQWERIEEGMQPTGKANAEGTGNGMASLFELNEGGTTLRVIHDLGDGSAFSLVGTRVSPGGAFTELDLVLLRLYVHQFDLVFQAARARQTEKGLVFSLNQRVLQLTSLIDTGIEVSRLDAGMNPHRLALERATSLTNASRGFLTVEGEDGKKECFGFPLMNESIPEAHPDHQITSGFTFRRQTYTFQLFEKEGRRKVEGFDGTDQMILDALVRQVHAALENRYLLGQSLEKQRIEQDIAVAASIQQRILPAALPVIGGYDFAGINIPSKSVGGDYYDCIPLADGRYALVIADVSGKGVPAALLVSSLHAYLSAYLESPIALVDLARRLNRVIWSAATEDKFITAFIGLLTPSTGELTTVNAGHTPVYLVRNTGAVQELTAGGLPFGMLELDLPYTAESVVVERGERVLLFTDGVTEAMNEAGDLYDAAMPFKEYVVTHVPETAERFMNDLISDLKAFTGPAPQNDDITAMYMIRQTAVSRQETEIGD